MRPTAIGWAASSTSPTGPSWNASSRRRQDLADGRVMEVLSEHNCHGWLEGYTLTGRHGLFATYEAFAMVSASQTVQHSKWLEEADRLALAGAGSPVSTCCSPPPPGAMITMASPTKDLG